MTGPTMDPPLPAEERAFVARAAAFAAAVIAPDAAGRERRREALPRPAFRRYAAEGFAGLTVPRALGGQGASFPCKIHVAETMARACMASAFALNNLQSGIARLVREGTPEQRERWLPGLLAGDLVSTIVLTEPGAGSDASAMATLATKVDGGWRLRGDKAWVTNGTHADLALLHAQTAPGSGARGIACFLADLRAPGVTRGAPYGLIGGGAIGAAAIALDDVFVPDADLLAPPGEAFRRAMAGITAARVHVSAMVNGMVAECLGRAVDHAGTRRAFGRTLLEHQGLRWSLAEVATRLEASRLLVDRAALLVEQGRDAILEASQAKLFAVEMALPAVSACMQAMGADGLTDAQPFARHLAAARIAAYVDGTSEIQRDRIGLLLDRRYGGQALP
ncbi:acyl-CoA dehydrogenase family protein [Roseomonas sp. NAR14]|uniref:Acyl-CoA dehydrogenase family protein n=1 Tax=Roseomonas acroporae TaxID=2937791 RepID=A0A9X2BU96_9PROT|nr:acyl-CoA dehydrogenase family protein [Roseomonas acroporae]MCK8785277.1 acyl-CoA dehydrogenase family protein [Roseomonas acroporae]